MPKPPEATPDGSPPASRQVSWLSVHEYVTTHLTAEHWPTIGTPAWCELPDDHPAKQAAILDAAQHWALRLETNQQVLADAAKTVAAAADWSAIATHIRGCRGSGYILKKGAA